eukprot:751476-Hanusia_phi.AAC.3
MSMITSPQMHAYLLLIVATTPGQQTLEARKKRSGSGFSGASALYPAERIKTRGITTSRHIRLKACSA